MTRASSSPKVSLDRLEVVRSEVGFVPEDIEVALRDTHIAWRFIFPWVLLQTPGKGDVPARVGDEDVVHDTLRRGVCVSAI